MNGTQSLSMKSLEKMTKAELIECLRSLQSTVQQPSRAVDESKRQAHDMEIFSVGPVSTIPELRRQKQKAKPMPASKTKDGLQACEQQAGEKLSESEDLFRNLADTAPVLIWISGTDKLCYFFNKPWLDFTGRSLEEESGNGWAEGVYPDDLPRCLGIYTNSFEAREPFKMEYRLRRYDGEYCWVLDHGVPRFSSSGQFLGYIGSCIDITAHRKTEETLRESQKQFESIIEASPDGIITIDEEQRIIHFSRAAEQIFRCSSIDVLGEPIERFLPECNRARRLSPVEIFSDEGDVSGKRGAVRIVYGLRADGEEFPMEVSISKIELSGRSLYIIIQRDITESIQAHEQLIEQAALLNQSHEAIVARDLNNRVRYWSRGAESLYGWTAEEAVGRPIQELIYCGKEFLQLAIATSTVKEKGEWNGEFRHSTKDGREVIVDSRWSLVRDANGTPKTILAINSDITEKKQLEAHQQRTHRLESIGALASGIAHDLNNILAPILLGVQMLQLMPQDEQGRRLLAIMQANAERGAEMIKQVLSFARGFTGERVTVYPKQLIREIVKIAEETFPRSIQINQRLAENVWATSVDPTQLHQVLLNLCVNARDAMPNGGTLTIEAENQTLDEMYANMLNGARAGAFIVLTVTDTGEGIPAEFLNRIFDPFFTTKGQNQGTGLGLATVHGIVASHNGFILVESKAGIGTKFRIYLPPVEATSCEELEKEYTDIPPGNGELILVIDDEPAVREMTTTALETFGYRTMDADNGATALGVFAPNKEEIRLVITDLMMPIMDGPITIHTLRKLNPHIKIIDSSGQADSPNLEKIKSLCVEDFLEKPYSAKTLLMKVGEALRKNE